MRRNMREYRITRANLYTCGAQGESDVSARQGHYVYANCVHEAIQIMEERYPGELFDVQVWRGPEGLHGAVL